MQGVSGSNPLGSISILLIMIDIKDLNKNGPTSVLLLHDVFPHQGNGLLTNDKTSKYLLHKKIIKESIQKCKEKNIKFLNLYFKIIKE